MESIIISLEADNNLAADLAVCLAIPQLTLEHRAFPDGESYLRLDGEVDNKQTIVVCSLDQPNVKTVPLILLAASLREQGAASVMLVAPYLAYMRQDICFNPGETVNARHYAALLSRYFDGLVTVDPHLHRIAKLEDIYTVPCETLHAAPLLSHWLQLQRDGEPLLLVGPDAESEQWVRQVATAAEVPYVVLDKQRHGDRDVTITLPDVTAYYGHRPVFVDDMISTGHTLVTAAGLFPVSDFAAPWALAVHGLFASGADAALLQAGFARLLTCNTVSHSSNAINIAELLAEGVRALQPKLSQDS